jgi:hypothetical protein
VRASLLLGGIRTKVKDVGRKTVTGEVVLTRKRTKLEEEERDFVLIQLKSSP